jgi:hypothetical protein
MKVKPTTRVRGLVRRHPDVEDILGWYGVEVGPDNLDLDLEELCQNYRLDIDDVLTDIAASVENENEDGEAADEDEETEKREGGDDDDDDDAWEDDEEEDEDEKEDAWEDEDEEDEDLNLGDLDDDEPMDDGTDDE